MLRRDLHLLRELPVRLDELAGLVAQLAEATATNTNACGYAMTGVSPG